MVQSCHRLGLFLDPWNTSTFPQPPYWLGRPLSQQLVASPSPSFQKNLSSRTSLIPKKRVKHLKTCLQIVWHLVNNSAQYLRALWCLHGRFLQLCHVFTNVGRVPVGEKFKAVSSSSNGKSHSNFKSMSHPLSRDLCVWGCTCIYVRARAYVQNLTSNTKCLSNAKPLVKPIIFPVTQQN